MRKNRRGKWKEKGNRQKRLGEKKGSRVGKKTITMATTTMAGLGEARLLNLLCGEQRKCLRVGEKGKMQAKRYSVPEAKEKLIT